MGTTQGSIRVTSNFPITLNINVSILSFLILVSGDANFHMERSALTVGFIQPSVAKGLIELPASVEKGLAQRFLWIFPRPSFAKFETLELVEERFSSYIGKYIC